MRRPPSPNCAPWLLAAGFVSLHLALAEAAARKEGAEQGGKGQAQPAFRAAVRRLPVGPPQARSPSQCARSARLPAAWWRPGKLLTRNRSREKHIFRLDKAPEPRLRFCRKNGGLAAAKTVGALQLAYLTT